MNFYFHKFLVWLPHLIIKKHKNIKEHPNETYSNIYKKVCTLLYFLLHLHNINQTTQTYEQFSLFLINYSHFLFQRLE